MFKAYRALVVLEVKVFRAFKALQATFREFKAYRAVLAHRAFKAPKDVKVFRGYKVFKDATAKARKEPAGYKVQECRVLEVIKDPRVVEPKAYRAGQAPKDLQALAQEKLILQNFKV